MKAQKKVFFPVVLFLCFLVFGFFPTASSGQTNLWTLDKSSNVTELTLSLGQQYIANFKLVIDLSPDRYGVPEFPLLAVFDTSLVEPGNPDGAVGLVEYGVDVLPKTFNYGALIGPYNECGVFTFTNKAKICNDSTDTWVITVRVPCEGCTLTPGYWKTHSEFGPAPYDDTWALLSSGADTDFYLSGQSWYEVLWTPPAKGNAYYILAHAFIAAKLNILNGASSSSEVDAALNWAEVFFGANTPGSYANRKAALEYAGILDNYNNGLIGPGHCSEEGIS